jgi:hypothetical protein
MIGLVAGVVNGNQSDSSAELSCFKAHGGSGGYRRAAGGYMVGRAASAQAEARLPLGVTCKASSSFLASSSPP